MLAAVLLIVAARSGLALWPEPRSLQVALAGSYLILIASAYLVFGGVPAMYATWRSVGALILRPETATVRPGENLVAVAEMVRPSRNLKAFLLLHDSSSKATDSLANRYQGTVVASSEAEGVWTARVSVQVPGDALPTLEELTDDVESPWRYWQLEVIAEDANGRKTSRLCDISVRANS
ncbi:MAG: hypothetical protein HYZ74_09230 [Elusimicrobia bacterium]|nr:hypothetical protein [Elusimicrobiota bacterium]